MRDIHKVFITVLFVMMGIPRKSGLCHRDMVHGSVWWRHALEYHAAIRSKGLCVHVLTGTDLKNLIFSEKEGKKLDEIYNPILLMLIQNIYTCHLYKFQKQEM